MSACSQNRDAWPDICARHQYRGIGKCPRCEGERKGREILDLLRRQEKVFRRANRV